MVLGVKRLFYIGINLNSMRRGIMAEIIRIDKKRLTDKPLILLNTHGDGDHTSGTNGFSDIYFVFVNR